MKKHLTFKDDKSDKFWSIEVTGTSFTVTYGKTGTDGQTSTKDFDTEEKCMKEVEKLVNEKLKKGYEEESVSGANKIEKTDSISLQESIKLIRKRKSKLTDEIVEQLKAFYDIEPNILIHREDISISTLIVGKKIVLVNGDLTVEGIIEDSYKAESSLLIVLGNVKCKSLITLSAIMITGDLIIDNVLLGDSLCDYTLNVGGNLKTETILNYGHSIIVNKKIKANYIYSNDTVDDENGDVESNLEEEDLIKKITDESSPDLLKTIKYIKSGGAVFHRAK